MRLTFRAAAIALAALAVLGALAGSSRARSFADLFDRVRESVVVIRTLEHHRSGDNFSDVEVEQGLGSGVIVAPDGLIMTAAHVVNLADEVTVQLADGRKFKAEVIGAAVSADVALIRLTEPPAKLQYARLGDSDKIRIGDEVFVVGAPYGVAHTLTLGHLSGRHRSQGVPDRKRVIEFLQTDAAVNRGNSGGPLFNDQGRVIGVVSRIMSQSGGSEGLGFAVSVNTARSLLLDRPSFWLGVEYFLAGGVFAKALNLPQEAGLLIQRVADHSPGKALGLREGSIPVIIAGRKLILGGDVILNIQNVKVTMDLVDLTEIGHRLASLQPGEMIRIKVLRGGREMDLTAVNRIEGPHGVPGPKGH